MGSVIEVHARERVLVLSGSGEWDLATADQVRPHLEIAVSGAWPLIVVDLARVDFMDVAGAKPIRTAVRSLRSSGRKILLVHPRSHVEKVLRLTGLGDFVVPVEELPNVDHVQELLGLA